MKNARIVLWVIGFILASTCCWAGLASDLSIALGVPSSNVLIKSATVSGTAYTNPYLVNIENTYSTKYDDTYYVQLGISYCVSRPITVPVKISWKIHPAVAKVRAYITVDGVKQQPELSSDFFFNTVANMSFNTLEIMWLGNVVLVVEQYNGSSKIATQTYSLPQSGINVSL